MRCIWNDCGGGCDPKVVCSNPHPIPFPTPPTVNGACFVVVVMSSLTEVETHDRS